MYKSKKILSCLFLISEKRTNITMADITTLPSQKMSVHKLVNQINVSIICCCFVEKHKRILSFLPIRRKKELKHVLIIEV